jgi:hypothetical protein
MTPRESFDDALDAAIDQIRGGLPLADVLAAHAGHADALRPLLEMSLRAYASVRTDAPPMSSGLADNFTIVRAALERERMSAARWNGDGNASSGSPWWQRRWTIASMSLPAGVFIFAAFAGASGAAAATVAMTNPDVVGKVASVVAPEWAEELVPHDGDGNANGQGEGPDSGDHGEAGSGVQPTTAAVGPSSDATHPPVQGNIEDVTVAGLVDDAHGSTFTLRSGDETWKVQLDSNTDVSGEIIDGAQATVTGTQTGSQTVHADTVVATEGVETTPTPKPGNGNPPETPPGHGDRDQNGNAGGNGNNAGGNGNGNGDAGANSTGGDGAGGANAPPGQAKKTPSPTVSAEAGGAQGNGNGNGNAGGNGNDGGSKKP